MNICAPLPSQAVEMCRAQAARCRNLAKELSNDLKGESNPEVEARVIQYQRDAENWEAQLEAELAEPTELPEQLQQRSPSRSGDTFDRVVFAVLFCLVGLLGLAIGFNVAENCVHKAAVAAGAGAYVLDSATGKPEFKFYSPTEVPDVE